jgi:hypothetical protein
VSKCWKQKRRRKEKRCKRLGCVQPRLSSVWHTGLSGAPGWTLVNRSLSGEVWRWSAIIHRTVRWWVSGAPTAPRRQRSTVPFLEGNRAPDSVRWCTGLSGAPPDRKQLLPSKCVPTAPRPLVPIKGTPRRLKQRDKCNQQVQTSLGSILTLPLVCNSLVCVEGKAKPLESGEELPRASARWKEIRLTPSP